MAVREPNQLLKMGKVDDKLVIQIMRALRCGTVYGGGPGAGAFPDNVGIVLEKLMPPGGLLPFLQRHPELFELHIDGRDFTFQCKEAIGVAAVDIQVSASGPSAPADGGPSDGGSHCGEVGIPPGLGLVNPMPKLPPLVLSWSVQNVLDYLRHIELPHLEPAVRLNGISGALLMDCQPLELELAGFTQLQVKKIFGSFPHPAE